MSMPHEEGLKRGTRSVPEAEGVPAEEGVEEPEVEEGLERTPEGQKNFTETHPDKDEGSRTVD
jgi:hypothetical protein